LEISCRCQLDAATDQFHFGDANGYDFETSDRLQLVVVSEGNRITVNRRFRTLIKEWKDRDSGQLRKGIVILRLVRNIRQRAAASEKERGRQ
jgi:hypothetical protein